MSHIFARRLGLEAAGRQPLTTASEGHAMSSSRLLSSSLKRPAGGGSMIALTAAPARRGRVR